MAKTGSGGLPGTAEGAALGRALHARFADTPVLADDWAEHLLSAADRARFSDAGNTPDMHAIEGFDASGVFAVNVGCLRYAEDEVLRSLHSGLRQYLVLGAGLDTFALRHGTAVPGLKVYEVDHPDVQALKRARIAAASRVPAALPEFVAVDFETDALNAALLAAGFDSATPAVASWLNTLHYLTEEAIRASMAHLSTVLAPGSRLVLNYAPDVDFSEAQLAYVLRLLEVVDTAGEPMASRWRPEAFVSLLGEFGFSVVEHLDEEQLTERYFSARGDGLRPAIPLRVMIAEKVTGQTTS
ncbi:MAG: SAM-dependent methyltransferase [Halioglobus sp.]|nr:SAM-dependent methyltransferase [Halioglobus sp.]